MPSTRDQIYALAKLKRSRKNLEKIQALIQELDDFATQAEDALSAIRKAREALDELSDTLDIDDNPLMPDVQALRDAISEFPLPEDPADITELISEAKDYAEEYENCLDDKDYSADDREEVWGNLCNALEDIADVMS